MPNKYSSNIRRIYAPAIKEGLTIASPADLSFPVTALRTLSMCMFPQEWLNPDSIITVHSMGLFCNFADGLVFKNPNESIHISLFAVGMNEESNLPPCSIVAGTRTLQGLGATLFLTDPDPTKRLSVGNFIWLNFTPQIPDESYIFRVIDVPAEDEATLDSYSPLGIGVTHAGLLKKMQTLSGSAGAGPVFNIRTLNEMQACEFTINPLSVSTTPFTRLGILAQYRSVTGIKFLTKSISTAFNGDAVVFDIAADIEITPVDTYNDLSWSP